MFAEWFSILCDQFLRSFGPVDRADALGLYQMEASLQEAVEMITIAKEATLDELRDLTDRQRDLAESMPSLGNGCSRRVFTNCVRAESIRDPPAGPCVLSV